MTNRQRRAAFNKEIKRILKEYGALRAGTLTQLNALFNNARDRINLTLRRAPSDYALWLLPQLEAQISAIMAGISAQATQAVQAALSSAWANGELLIDSPMAAAGVSISSVAPSIDTRQLLAIQHVTTKKIAGITLELTNKINTQLGLVVMGVQPPATALTAITNLLDETDRSRALGILRTEIGRVNSIASHLRKASAATVLPGLKKQWRRSGRKDPRETHVAADGQIRDLDQPFQIGSVQMMHPHDPAAPAAEVINCGCISLPYMESWTVSAPGARN